MAGPSWLHRLGALVRQRCPVCLGGRVFTGFASMHDRCPACDYRFEREPGYFVGSMYVSYGLSIGGILVLTLAVHLLWPSLDLGLAVLVAAAVYVPLVPLAWRYSRILWMYYDLWVWPEKKRPR